MTTLPQLAEAWRNKAAALEVKYKSAHQGVASETLTLVLAAFETCASDLEDAIQMQIAECKVKNPPTINPS